eukprot:gene25406-biopygen9029
MHAGTLRRACHCPGWSASRGVPKGGGVSGEVPTRSGSGQRQVPRVLWTPPGLPDAARPKPDRTNPKHVPMTFENSQHHRGQVVSLFYYSPPLDRPAGLLGQIGLRIGWCPGGRVGHKPTQPPVSYGPP